MKETSILTVIDYLSTEAYPKKKFRVKWQYYLNPDILLFNQSFRPDRSSSL